MNRTRNLGRLILSLMGSALFLSGCYISDRPLLAGTAPALEIEAGNYVVLRFVHNEHLDELTPAQQQRCQRYTGATVSQSFCDMNPHTGQSNEVSSLVRREDGTLQQSAQGVESVIQLEAIENNIYLAQGGFEGRYIHGLLVTRGRHLEVYGLQCRRGGRPAECRATSIGQLRRAAEPVVLDIRQRRALPEAVYRLLTS